MRNDPKAGNQSVAFENARKSSLGTDKELQFQGRLGFLSQAPSLERIQSVNRAAAALEAHSTRMEVSSFLYS